MVHLQHSIISAKHSLLKLGYKMTKNLSVYITINGHTFDYTKEEKQEKHVNQTENIRSEFENRRFLMT